MEINAVFFFQTLKDNTFCYSRALKSGFISCRCSVNTCKNNHAKAGVAVYELSNHVSSILLLVVHKPVGSANGGLMFTHLP